MTKTLKIILPVLMVLLLLCPVNSQAFSGFDDLKSQADGWVEGGKGSVKISEDDIAKILLPIGKFLVAIGAIVVVGVTIIMGIKYMSAADPGTQAKIKQQLIGLVVAAVIIFGAVGIWTLVYNFMDSVV